MVLRKIGLGFKNQKVFLDVKVCSNIFSMMRGLMFRRQNSAPALFFDFGKDGSHRIHSYFVFFPFLAIWINSSGKIVDFKMVKSFESSVLPKEPFSRLIEIPMNRFYSDIILLLVGKIKRFK
jgi:uncharacterized membrane protein (UPF0127 family)